MKVIDNIIFILLFSWLITITLICMYGVKQGYRFYKRNVIIESYPTIYTILDGIKSICYKRHYHVILSVHIASGQKITAEELSALGKEYLTDVIDLLGPSMVSDFEIIHGDLESFYLSIINDFKTSVIKDEALYSNVRNKIVKDGEVDQHEIASILLQQITPDKLS